MRLSALILTSFLVADMARAEEGYWPFSSLPLEKMKSEIGLVLNSEFLDRAKATTLRLNNGCTAALIGPEGLVMTAQHCVTPCLEQISSDSANFLTRGIAEPRPAENLKCSGLAAEQLIADEDVTSKLATTLQGLSGADYVARLNKEVGETVSACEAKDSSLRCYVVQYFNASQFRLQTYRSFDDVRMVFAPEHAMAQFGGFPDNFNYPRFSFDVALLRIYKDGAPLALKTWSPLRHERPADGEAFLVAGFPSFTSRHYTVAQLEVVRDVYYPGNIARLSDLRGRLVEFSKRAGGPRAIVDATLYDVENVLKAMSGEHDALAKTTLINTMRATEAEIIQKNPDSPVAKAYAAIAAAEQVYVNQVFGRSYLNSFWTPAKSWGKALDLAKAIRQFSLPEEQRLPEYREENRNRILEGLVSPLTYDSEFDAMVLEFGLSRELELRGIDSPYVKALLGKENVSVVAKRAVTETALITPQGIQAALDAGISGLDATQDQLLKLAAVAEAEISAAEQVYFDTVDAPEVQAHQVLTKMRYSSTAGRYPDADSSLRLAYGRIAGWEKETAGMAPSCTTVADLANRTTGHAPFKLADSWQAAISKLDPKTPVTCVTTHDIVGGNSGSAMLDATGKVAGLVFDGNLPSLGGTYFYDGKRNRAIVLSAPIIREALKTVYGLSILPD